MDYQSQSKGNAGLWYFVKYSSQSDKKIYFVDYPSQSDLKIIFVKYKSQSGWRKNSKNIFLLIQLLILITLILTTTPVLNRYKDLISQINLKELLDKIIELHFDNYKFTQKGSLEWYPITEKQKENILKSLKELKIKEGGIK